MPKAHVAEALRESEPAIIEIGAQWGDPLPYVSGGRRNSGWGLGEVALATTLGAVGVAGAGTPPLSLAIGAILLMISPPGSIFLACHL